jgi:hypothetical protein
VPNWLAETQRFDAEVQAYLEKLQQAEQHEGDAAYWREVTAVGEALLAQESQPHEGVNWAALRESVASNYNALGNALYATDKAASLSGYERACELQPSFAMFHRNRAGTLIELGRLGEAAAAIAIARPLEPEAARLPELEAELAKAGAGD